MMIVIFLLLLMVNPVFGVAIANMMIKTPSAVLPVWGALIVAFIIGQCIYRYKMNLVWVSIIEVTALYGLIYLGIGMIDNKHTKNKSHYGRHRYNKTYKKP